MSLLDRERTVAPRGYNRWLIPPAALAVHLSIGEIYAFSVFKVPLKTHFGTGLTPIGIIFSIAIGMLGLSAAFGGRWVERAGPRKAMSLAAVCWGSGFLIGAVGVATKQLWIVYLGVGFIGGIGLGIGYISPVSTLIKWFPDRRGMATGMAIMGFGGGAMIGSPLADSLIKSFRTADSAGVWQTLAVMGVGYILFMLGGAFGYRVPPAGWRPDGWTAPAAKNAMIASGHVHLRDAHKTFQFWMIWLVLFLNVSAGIGVLALASPMLQEIFGGELIGLPGTGFSALDAGQKAQVAAIAAGFVGLLSLFNILGRFFWASMSDRIGRKVTYAIFFALGGVLYAAAPWAAGQGQWWCRPSLSACSQGL